ncbi:Outer membrane receptor proteins, mostly Fe transport [Algoriphagus ornithinivorans]|uniref:Outer membrane receptor proteins, mostly Fe transport n=1 Tax=Algoriphagus ornithinivorans TaxID=226506 RepID=A0A1I5K107_9BACT|nr:carboxypeptidase regulatory-like domain-containing protein [Algoriphagus ornithinivorans]SFO78722.1 Outer membrane receptor proteins, mostly Fe transport [Algoriphagus ornithinivorans]
MRQNLLRNLLAMFLVVLSTNWAMSQGVTTANIQGLVTDSSGDALPGANVVATHEPSGTRYGAVSNLEGRFVLPNMRVGGPYTVRITFVGFEERAFEGIVLGLGQTYTLNAVLSDGLELEAIEVIASKDAIMNADKTGAALNLTNERINALPTVNRNINDFTRLTPQSNGTSFAGTSSRFNNYTIDGNIYNNNFGLGSGQFAGSNPISLDAIEEVQVNLAPFDVRQAGFTGAAVNAITKSGTNEFTGSAYYFLRNDQMLGDKVGDTRLNKGDSKNEIAGFRVGGPIIKNKLFFFVSYEKETEAVPSFTKVAARPGLTPDGLIVSRVPASELDFVREQMRSLYGYETGPYENYPFASEQERFNARLDWNINQNHKLSIRYNDYSAFTDVPTNGNSIRYISTRYRNTSRTGIEAMNFRNANYTNDRSVKSWVAELNSRIGSNMSNQINVGFTSITDPKRGVPGGQAFPFIEVLEPDASGNLLYYFSLGNELFTVGNLLENNIFNFTDNFSIYKGKHTYTFGVNFEYMTFQNAFNPVFNGFYRFNSYNDFVSTVINRTPGTYPEAFAKGYALDGSTTPPVDETRFGQIGFYVQDEYQITPKMKVTGGLRVDFPFYPIDIPNNQLLDNLNKTFETPDGRITPDVSLFPKVNPLWSPRVGFNWDAKGNRTTQVRGGTGIFSGRIPFVWLSNQVNGSGVVRGGLGYEGDDVEDEFGPNYVFNPDVTFGNPENPGQSLSNELNLTDRDFKLPQVWRTNLAVDQVLPFGIIGTLEFIYSRDVSTPIAYNPVLRTPDGTLSGPDTRPFWNGTNYSNDPDFRNVFYLTNARKKADYYSFTAQLQKQFDNGFYTMIAYTRSRSRDLDAAGGSQAISLWPATVQVDRNNPDLSFAGFDIPNRLIGSIAYQTDNTTISIFYEGADAGRFSYTYSGNFGDASNRLMYIPNSASELVFQQFTLNGRVVTPAEQAALLDAYIDQDKYLSANRGKIAERNGALRPWVNRFDLRITEDLVLSKDSKNKLQLSIDILNVGNLFNSEWGIQKFAFQDNLLNYRGVNAQGQPQYRLNTVPGTSEFPTETFRTSTSLGDTWRMQVGVRYIFN